MGELFNRNPDVFYLFEPLAGIQGEHSTTGCHRYPENKITHLKRYYNCQSPLFYDIFKWKNPKSKKIVVEKNRFIAGDGQIIDGRDNIPDNGVPIIYPEHGQCNRHNLCFRADQQWSCDPGICHVDPKDQDIALIQGQSEKSCKACGPLSNKLMDQVCLNTLLVY